MDVKGRLTAKGYPSFTGFRIVAEYETPVADEMPPDGSQPPATIRGRRTRTVAAAADGTFTVTLPDTRLPIAGIELRAVRPDGLVAGSVEVPEGQAGRLLRLPVTLATPTTVEGSGEPALGAQLRYTGRIIDDAGRAAVAGLVVVIWAARPGAEEPAPVSVAETATNGYFSAPWPDDVFPRAQAVVSGGEAVPIVLEDGRLPLRFVLVLPVLPSPPAPEEDCSCPRTPPRAPDAAELAANPEAFSADPGRCVDFTIPNRAVEEVVYQAVVRTTQPALNPPDPPPPPRVPPGLIGRLATLAQVRPELIAVSGTTDDGDAGSTGPVLSRSAAGRPAVPVGAPAGFFAVSAGPLGAAFDRAAALTPGLDLSGVFRRGTAPQRDAVAAVLEARAAAGKPIEIEPSVLVDLARESRDLTPLRLLQAENTSIVRRFRTAVGQLAEDGAGRFTLSETRQIDWDDIPDRYQATTIAHGHLLSLKQVWRSDGYSLGDLLYSLPLAPGQQKLVSILDWNRDEVASRRAERESRERLEADLVHDRDISDIIRSTLTERLDGSSRARVAGAGGVIGGFIGPLVFGAAGGVSSASSTASQTSARSVSGLALNRVRDRTQQAASAVRSQRATVVQTGRQGESVRAQTEAVANYNHCHAVTVEYFEVLRHLQVTQELAHVQECLFIPFSIAAFNVDRALRWRDPLEQGLREAQLRWAFGALERLRDNWEDADYPPGRYADERITHLDAELHMRLTLPRPADGKDGEFLADRWKPYEDEDLLGPDNAQAIWQRYLGGLPPAAREAVWEARIAPAVAQRLIEKLDLRLLRQGGAPVELEVDPTLVGRYRSDRPLPVSLRVSPPALVVTRAEVTRVELRFDGVTTLPAGAEVRVDSATMSYRTAHFTGTLFSDRRVLNDLSLRDSGEDTVQIATPLSVHEKRDPRLRDRRYAEKLLEHLNEHVEYYHRAIWQTMDPNRRFLLLDGLIAPDAGGRSVASVVENRVIGIVGNSLVMPVAPGQKLDTTYEFAAATLDDLRHLYAVEAAPPMRISIPSSGVFAEAVAGRCNSCETIDDTRFWRFEEEPLPDTPTAIGALSTASRRRATPSLAPDAFPDALVRLQQAPAAPDPTGLAAAVQALGTANIFRDLTGLALNQQNAAQALKSSLKVGQEFASRAASLAQQRFQNRQLDRNLGAIKKARDQGMTDRDSSQTLTEELFSRAIGEKRPTSDSPTKSRSVQRAIDRVSESRSGSLRITRPQGSVELEAKNRIGDKALEVAIEPRIVPIRQRSAKVCWAAAAAMMRSWQLRAEQTVETVLDALGGDWRQRFEDDVALRPAELRVLMAALGLVEEGAQTFTPQGLARLLGSGPLLAVGDDGVRDNRIVHVRIVTRVSGDGTPGGTRVFAADPADGAESPLEFSVFARNLEATEAVATGLGSFHF
jgi:hypothetical protein